MDHADVPNPISIRLREGFGRIALILRADLWSAVGDGRLNHTQAQVLTILAGRPTGLRSKDIAAQLAVSAPSIADTLSALERKGLLQRISDPGDARAVISRLTKDGRAAASRIAAAASQVNAALAQLSPAEQANLLLIQMKLIRILQLAGAIPLQRMCVSCRHFRPNNHPGHAQPHNCAFVNAAIGDQDLRLDCSEHEGAGPMTLRQYGSLA